MPPKTTHSSSMKQGTLGFSSTKRGSSIATKSDLKGKKSTPTTPVTPAPKNLKRKASSLQSASPSDSSIQTPSPVPMKKSEASLKANMSAKDDDVVIIDDPKVELKLENYALDDKDKRWKNAVKQSRKVSETVVQAHKGNQSDIHQLLRVFDMSYEYGPAVGLTRLERWQRAERLGLKPPSEIREILMTKEGHGRNEYRLNVLDQLSEL